MGRLTPNSLAAGAILPEYLRNVGLNHLPLQILPRVLEGQIGRAGLRGQFQVPHCQALSFRHDDGAADVVFQLPHIARPGIAVQGAQGLLIQRQPGLALLFGELLQEKLRQQTDVPLPIAQGRQDDLHHCQAIKQVLAERSRQHAFAQIRVGRRHHPGVNRDGLPAAHPFDALFLEKAQQFDLQRERNLADFVQEKRSAVGASQAGLCAGRGRR